MRRATVLCGLIAVGALSVGLTAFQPPAQQGPKVIEVEKVKDNLFMLKGGGGNTAVYVGPGGVTVGDAKNPGWGLPLLDMNNGGSGGEIGTTLTKAHAGIKNVDSIITGHSTLMTWDDLAEYAQFNKDFLADVRAGMKAGKSADEIAAGWKPAAKYKD